MVLANSLDIFLFFFKIEKLTFSDFFQNKIKLTLNKKLTLNRANISPTRPSGRRPMYADQISLFSRPYVKMLIFLDIGPEF